MIQDIWPAGSFVVVMNGKPKQITIPSASRGLERHYRFGPSKQPISAKSFRHVVQAFKGNGYRPYPVTHLRMLEAGTTHAFSWIRATRIDGDFWGNNDVPLGEESELYQVTIVQDGLVKRQTTTTEPSWAYGHAARQSDLVVGEYQISVAQISARYGSGPARALLVAALP